MSVFTISNATDIYQRNESKLVFVVVVILSAYLIAFAAKITWSLIPQPDSSDSQQARQIQQLENTNAVNISNNINKVINQNLFGNANAKITVTPAQQVTEVPQTKLNLILSGVVSSDDPTRGAAIIEHRNNQSTYGVGDKIEGTDAILDEIYVDRVIIKNRLARETLMLDGIDFEEANRRRVSESDTSMATAEQTQLRSPQSLLEPKQDIRNQAQALRQAREKLTQEPASFTDMISLAPHRVDGVFIGFKVTPGSKPELFNSVGLKNGDVVVLLNGLDLSDLEQSKEAMAQLQEAQSLQLEVLRDGEFISLELDIPEVSGNE